jgi:site-specific DNA-methyltransferase (adenine-specific)
MTANCINGDCLEVMKTLPDKSIDLFLCDLPYGCLSGGGGNEKKKRSENGNNGIQVTGGCAWDIKIDLAEFWTQVKRLCKNDKTPVLMFCNMRFAIDLINSNPKWFRYDLVWNKNYGTNFLTANIQPISSHELILVFSNKMSFYKRIDHFIEGKPPYTYAGGKEQSGRTFGKGVVTMTTTREAGMRCPVSVINFPREQNKRHPTCKSVELYKWLVERYSNEGDTVLDPTAGSFNSGRASIELGRYYIGIEKDDEFFNENKI